MAFTYGGQIGSSVNDTSSTTTATITVGGGGVPQGAAVVVWATKSVSVASMTATDSKGNTYTTQVTDSEPVDSQTISLITSVLSTALVSGDTITITYGATFSEKTAVAAYFTAAGTIAFGTSASGNSTFPHTTKTAGSLTVNDDELVVAAYIQNSAPNTWTPGSGFTTITTVNGTSAISSSYGQYVLDTNTTGSFATPASTASGSSTGGVSGRFTETASASGSVTYVAAGAAATATSGNVTPSYPAGIAADDILVCEITSYDNVSVSFGGSGWTKKTETNNGSALRQTIAWKRRATGDSDTNVVITHTAGDRIIARVHALRNCKKNGDPFEDTAVNTPSAAASGTFPTVTTVVPGDMLVYALSYGNDFSTGPSISNAQGLTLTERDETEVA